MKVLLAHNFYGSSAPSGENRVYLAEKELLKSHGHTVIEFTRYSDEIRNRGFVGKLQGGLATPWNPFTEKKIRHLLKTEKPEILHVHNTFPLLSPSIFQAAEGSDVATVYTVHNYRIYCAAGSPMRNSLPCMECLDKQNAFPALKYGCYRESRIATFPMVVMIGLHRRMGTWQKYVDAFITLSEFQKEKLIGAGLPAQRVYVKPNFYPAPPLPRPWLERQRKVVFIGRLSPEKGVHVLLEAWKEWGEAAPLLELIGDGKEKENLRKSLKNTVAEKKVCFTGQLLFDQTQERLAEASLLILPSLCFEGFPMVIREAFALGVPVVASRIGAIPFIIKDGDSGMMFQPGDSTELLKVVKALWENSTRLSNMAEAARKEFEIKYTADENYDMLMEIYRAAIKIHKKKQS